MIKNTLVFAFIFLLSGCSLVSTSSYGQCIYLKCNEPTDKSIMIYNDDQIIRSYVGGFNESGFYKGEGVFYFKDDSKLMATLENGLASKGVYYYIQDGYQYTILFNDESLDPHVIRDHVFKNSVQLERVAGDFSYKGGFERMTLKGSGVLFQNDLVFDGVFNDLTFKGKISNNIQTQTFDIEPTDNSVLYSYTKGVEKHVLQGHFLGSVFKGVQSVYVAEKEVISYHGKWILDHSPFNYKTFSFESFDKSGLYEIKSNDGSINKGNFEDNKREGYFEYYKNNKLLGFDYYKGNKKLYYMPLYLELKSQVDKSKCNVEFPETLNVWIPYKFKSCVGDIYTVQFIDKENKSLLFEMVYNKKKNIVTKLKVYDKDKMYNFININTNKDLAIKEYTLKGKAKIYQWIDDRYQLLSTSIIDINHMKKKKGK
jgi:hypothetical protein